MTDLGSVSMPCILSLNETPNEMLQDEFWVQNILIIKGFTACENDVTLQSKI